MEQLFEKYLPDYEYIKVVNGRWSLNGKAFVELTINERNTLAEKIKSHRILR